jgi:hypothetical protein
MASPQYLTLADTVFFPTLNIQHVIGFLPLLL